jgi:hypothetical protein
MYASMVSGNTLEGHPMAAKSRKNSARRKPSTAGQKRPSRIARKMAKPVEIAPEATVERSPTEWQRLIDSLTEQRQVAADRLAKLRAKLAPLVLASETEVGTNATGELQRLRLDVNQAASRIAELDDALALARIELAKSESKAAAVAREVAKAELEGIHEERMALAGLIDETLETLGELVRQWSGSKFAVTSIARRIHGSEGDAATAVGRQVWNAERRSLRYALHKFCPQLCDLVEVPREPKRWHQSLAEGELYISSRMLKDSDGDRFERSLQLETPSTGPTETREQVVARIRQSVADEGELRLAAVKQGRAEEESAGEADDADPREAEVAAESGFSVRG